MNLPILGRLSNDESTYITFSKALLDLDEAITNGTEFYFSKVVAMNLPDWIAPTFYADLIDFNYPLSNHNPNVVLPKMIQHYMENIMRQSIEAIAYDINNPIKEITEIAFYKMLNALGMSKDEVQSRITFCNDIVTSNFTKVENNNGWGEIICQIPNKCRIFKPAFRTVDNLHEIISVNDEIPSDDIEQIPFYDTDSNADGNHYSMNGWNEVLDIENSSFDDIEQSSFDFNVLLLFYRDKDGIDKLHGINFIYPFEEIDGGQSWQQNRFTQKTNVARSIGYQFIFNLKTCNNEASLVKVYEQYENVMWWNGFEKTLTGLNSFLEYKMRDLGYEQGTIPHIFGE